MPDPRTCPSCATEIPAGARFCVKCGTEAPLAQPAPPAPAPAQAPAPAPPTDPTPAFGAGTGTSVPAAPATPPPAGAAEVPTQVPPGGVPQAAPTQLQPTDPTWGQPQQPAPPVAPGYTPAGAAPTAPNVAASPPVADYRYGYQDGAAGWQQPGVAPAVAPPAPAKPPKPKGSNRTVVAGLIGFLGALTLGVASFLPWAEIDSFRGITGAVVTGWDALTGGVQDGLPFVMVAVVAGAVAASMLAGRASILQKLLLLLAGGIGIGMSVYEIATTMTDIDDINEFGGTANLGYGLWVALVGGLLILVSALLAKRTKADATASPQPVGAQGGAASLGDPRAVGAVG